MNLTALSQIETKISQLTPHEQLWLIERIIHRLRKPECSDIENQLRAMASDQEIQRELHTIEEEFFGAESDGLEKI